MNQLFHAKEITTTPSGSTVIILQDGPASFHISVSQEKRVVYDHIINPTSIEMLREHISTLEFELFTQETIP